MKGDPYGLLTKVKIDFYLLFLEVGIESGFF